MIDSLRHSNTGYKYHLISYSLGWLLQFLLKCSLKYFGRNCCIAFLSEYVWNWSFISSFSCYSSYLILMLSRILHRRFEFLCENYWLFSNADNIDSLLLSCCFLLVGPIIIQPQIAFYNLPSLFLRELWNGVLWFIWLLVISAFISTISAVGLFVFLVFETFKSRFPKLLFGLTSCYLYPSTNYLISSNWMSV